MCRPGKIGGVAEQYDPMVFKQLGEFDFTLGGDGLEGRRLVADARHGGDLGFRFHLLSPVKSGRYEG